ncbi:MAG: VacB/RNase II family 3'-5' exoribonuclease [Phycisphaeraceae bacterium]|nr:VacB/RNase II family 3'-5' exoribonuclease [Phycisphaeraceae bacterium]
MTLKFEKRLIDHLKHERYEASTVERLGADLGIAPEDRGAFQAAVDDLVNRKILVYADTHGAKAPPIPPEQRKVLLPRMGDSVEGSFRKNQRGFGFVITDIPYREGDVFVPAEGVGNALSGDRVRVAIARGERGGFGGGGGGRFGGSDRVTGEIVEVLTRKRAAFTGELVKRGGLWVVMPDGKELTQPIWVKDPSVKNAREGDKVAVEITAYPDGSELPEGVITRVLGEAGLPDVETQAVIVAYDLPGEFPKACQDEARAATRAFDEEVMEFERGEIPGTERQDLRGEFIITIDPPDAKDYDDAISISRTADGGWSLGVHIADVAHFIHAGSAMDVEARERGNSVYLPRLVIPMLPETLSNGICSLSEGVVRFCKSSFMEYGPDGAIRKSGVASTAIKSAKRLTYLEAQALIDGDLREARKHAKTEPKYTDQLIQTLREMDRCAKAIRERRRKAGMIHLELPEVNLVFDETGHVVDAEPEDDAFTHTLIEMFMVEANEVLARLFEGMNVPLLRRVHPEPTPGDVHELRTAAKVAGFNIPKNPTRHELQSLLDATAGTGAARAVHMSVLRTLTRAEYSPALIGHFALASEAYAHFTSPIRRYPDLTVHRALAAYLSLTENGRKPPKSDQDRKRLGDRLRQGGAEAGVPEQDELVEIGHNCSQKERNAADAERSLRQFLVLQLLENHVGESFEGVVTGVTNAGVFIELTKYLCDGMIKSSDLPTGTHGQRGGRWQIDQRSGALVHPPTGRSFSMGDKVNVTVASVDLAMRKLDLVITDPKGREAGKAKTIAAKGGIGGGDGNDAWGLKNLDVTTGADRRARRSKQRDKAKTDFRQDRKKKGK